MSYSPLSCEKCQREAVFDRVGPFGREGPSVLYGVQWKCPGCQGLLLDVCPLGPAAPTTRHCLNCGDLPETPPTDPVCAACGMSFDEVRGMAADADDRSPQLLQRLCGSGLVRLATLVANARLLEDPALEEMWNFKRELLTSLGYREAVERLLREALAAGAPAHFHISLGCALQEKQRDEDAIRVYQMYRTVDPQGRWVAVSCCNEANSQARLGNHEEAERLFESAIRAEPDRATHRYNRARSRIDRSRYADALTDLADGLRISSEPALTIRFLEEQSFVSAELQRGEAALECIEKALALGSDSIRSHYLHGRALALVGRLEEAAAKMDVVLARDPSNADALRAKQMLSAAIPRPKPWWKLWS